MLGIFVKEWDCWSRVTTLAARTTTTPVRMGTRLKEMQILVVGG